MIFRHLVSVGFTAACVSGQAVAPPAGCLICGDGQVIRAPAAIVDVPGELTTPCGILQDAGLSGEIPLDQCRALPPYLGRCDCAPGDLPGPVPAIDVSITPGLTPRRSFTPSVSTRADRRSMKGEDGTRRPTGSPPSVGDGGKGKGKGGPAACPSPAPAPAVPPSSFSDIRTTTFLIVYFGTVDGITSREIELLEDALRDSYNALNGFTSLGFCDPFQRRIISVTIDIELDREIRGRKLRNEPNRRRFSTRPFPARVDFRCSRTCPRGSRLTGNDASFVRRTFERSMSSSDEEDCDDPITECPSGVELRPPTANEVLAAYNIAVQTLASGGLLETIDGVSDFSEVDEAVCDGEFSLEETDVLIDITGVRDQISIDDTLALEIGFMRTYNELARDSCDPSFRTITQVDITFPCVCNEGGRRRLMAPPGNSGVGKFPASAKIKFPCHRCPSGRSIFGNDGGIRALEFSENRRFMQDVVGNDRTCYCPINPVSSDAPSRTEFTISYNRLVTQEFDVPSIVSINAVEEGADPFPPTTISTMEPTPAPTNIRSMKAPSSSMGGGKMGSTKKRMTFAPAASPSYAPTRGSMSGMRSMNKLSPIRGTRGLQSGDIDPCACLPTSSPSRVPTSSPAPSLGPSISPFTSAPSADFLEPSVNPTSLPSADISIAPSHSPVPSKIPSNPPSSVFPSTNSPKPSPSPTNLSSLDPSIVPSNLPTQSTRTSPGPTRLQSDVPSNVPSGSSKPSQIPTLPPSVHPSGDLSDLPTVSPGPSQGPTALSSAQPSNVPSEFPTESPEPTSSPTSPPSAQPSSFPSDLPTKSPQPSRSPTARPSAQPSNVPSNSPTVSPEPSRSPTAPPSAQPSNVPSNSPTESSEPTSSPTSPPSAQPSNVPSNSPTVSPEPTPIPTMLPSGHPSIAPSDLPTVSPRPSQNPTVLSSAEPSNVPSYQPTESPAPSPSPTALLSTEPSNASPSSVPTVIPSTEPSTAPSVSSSAEPSTEPSNSPSSMPSSSDLPSVVPTGGGKGDTPGPTPRPTNELKRPTARRLGDAKGFKRATPRDDSKGTVPSLKRRERASKIRRQR